MQVSGRASSRVRMFCVSFTVAKETSAFDVLQAFAVSSQY